MRSIASRPPTADSYLCKISSILAFDSSGDKAFGSGSDRFRHAEPIASAKAIDRQRIDSDCDWGELLNSSGSNRSLRGATLERCRKAIISDRRLPGATILCGRDFVKAIGDLQRRVVPT